MKLSTNILGSALAITTLVAGAFGAASCSDDESASGTTDPCPNGICGSGASGPGGGGVGAGGPGSGGSGGGANTCGWVCSPWDTQGNGDAATRTCLDVNGCAEGAKPIESVTLPALDENYYRCNVEPILDRLCAQLGCHGVEPDLNAGIPGRALRTYHRGRLRITGDTLPGSPGCNNQPPQPSESCIGSIECACWVAPHTANEWQRNFDAARGFALDAVTGVELSDKAQSEMLTQPDKAGGLPHAGIKIWDSTDAGSKQYADYQTLLDWLGGTTLATCNSQN